jgi:hypothetical protein
MFNLFSLLLSSSIVGIAIGYGLDGRGGRSSIPDKVKSIHFSLSSRLSLGPTQPLVKCVQGALSPGVKRPGRKSDHPSPNSAEFKKTWIYTSTPLWVNA